MIDEKTDKMNKPKGKTKDLQIGREGRQTYGQTDYGQRQMIDEKIDKMNKPKGKTKDLQIDREGR